MAFAQAGAALERVGCTFPYDLAPDAVFLSIIIMVVLTYVRIRPYSLKILLFMLMTTPIFLSVLYIDEIFLACVSMP